MANNYYSLRSYNHFCFFDHINDSKKKKDELAFFIFFTFKLKRLLVADGPRQASSTSSPCMDSARLPTEHQSERLQRQGNIFTGIMILSMLFTVAVFAGSLIPAYHRRRRLHPAALLHQGQPQKENCCHKVDKARH